MPWRFIQGVTPRVGWFQVGVHEGHVLDERQDWEGSSEVRPPLENLPTGGDPPQQGLVESIEPLYASLYVDQILPDGRATQIYCHPI